MTPEQRAAKAMHKAFVGAEFDPTSYAAIEEVVAQAIHQAMTDMRTRCAEEVERQLLLLHVHGVVSITSMALNQFTKAIRQIDVSFDEPTKPVKPPEKKCGNCVFWQQVNLDGRDEENRKFQEKYGWCRRYPPTSYNNPEGSFPPTHADKWCGEHQFRVDTGEAAG